MKTPTLDWNIAPFTYLHPQNILGCGNLDAETKRDLLREWLEDERAMLAAADDGMPSGKSPRIDEINRALESIVETAA